jgi:hypothetical protein
MLTKLIALIVSIHFIYSIVSNGRIMRNFDEVLAAIDAATTAAATRVTALIESIKASASLTDAQQTEADAIVAHLNGIGADAVTPVPATTTSTTTE